LPAVDTVIIFTDITIRMSKLVEFVSKAPVPEHTKNLIFEVCVDDQSGEDVEVPFVCIKLR
jgi:ubiquitin-activating enzyme E1